MTKENLPKTACLFDELVPISKLKNHPKNPNRHSQEQLVRLAKILEYQGFRKPIVVSRRSGCITTGHGTLGAALINEWTHVPIVYQSYDSDDQEYAHIVSDNSIAAWAELDLGDVNERLKDLDGAEFNLDLLGLKDFDVTPNFEPGTEDEQGKLDEKKPVECPKCGHSFTP